MDPYKILEVERTATLDEIKASYRRLSREWHPDKGGSDEVMADINNAWDILKDPEKRDRYNRTGETQEGPNLEQVARGRIIKMFVDSANKHGWSQGNYIQAMRRGLDQGRSQLVNRESELNAVSSRMDSMIPDHPDAEENLFTIAVRQQQGQIKQELSSIDKELEIIDHAKSLLEPYKDNLPPQEFTNSFFFTSSNSTTSTGGF